MELQPEDNLTKPLAEISPNTPVSQCQGVAAMALTMALKYHDINTVQDGALYQQYKLEGKNMRGLDLAIVFDTAIQIENHLVTSEKRITKMLVDMLADLPEPDGDEPETSPETPASSDTQ